MGNKATWRNLLCYDSTMPRLSEANGQLHGLLIPFEIVSQKFSMKRLGSSRSLLSSRQCVRVLVRLRCISAETLRLVDKRCLKQVGCMSRRYPFVFAVFGSELDIEGAVVRQNILP